MLFNIYTEGNYTEVTIDNKTIISSYSLPIATIDNSNQSIIINLQAIEEFHSTTTSRHVNRAFITINEALDNFILATPSEQSTKINELFSIRALVTEALQATGKKRLECLFYANEKLSEHYYNVYDMHRLIYNFMNEGGF